MHHGDLRRPNAPILVGVGQQRRRVEVGVRGCRVLNGRGRPPGQSARDKHYRRVAERREHVRRTGKNGQVKVGQFD